MANYLSEEWIKTYADLGAALPKIDGATASVQYVVDGAPDGKTRWYELLRDGRVAEASLGKVKDPDITITWKAPEAIALLNGEKSADASFMQGRTKVEGDYVHWLFALRAWRASEPVVELRAAMVDATD